MLELRLETFFRTQIASSEGMIVKYGCNQAPVVSEDGDVPPEECHLAVVEDLHLLLIARLLVDVIDAPPQFLHGVL